MPEFAPATPQVTKASKSGLRKRYKTNPQTEIDGAWKEFPEAANEDGTIPAIKLARVGVTNMDHNKALEREMLQYRGKKMTTEQNIEASRKAFISTSPKDWRNILNDDGSPRPFSYDEVKALFQDLPEIYFDCATFANDPDNYKEGALEYVSGN